MEKTETTDNTVKTLTAAIAACYRRAIEAGEVPDEGTVRPWTAADVRGYVLTETDIEAIIDEVDQEPTEDDWREATRDAKEQVIATLIQTGTGGERVPPLPRHGKGRQGSRGAEPAVGQGGGS